MLRSELIRFTLHYTEEKDDEKEFYDKRFADAVAGNLNFLEVGVLLAIIFWQTGLEYDLFVIIFEIRVHELGRLPEKAFKMSLA